MVSLIGAINLYIFVYLVRENVCLQVSQLLCHPFCPQPPNRAVLVSISQYNTHTHMYECLYTHIRTYTCRHTAACCAIVEFSSFLFSLAALFAPLCLYQSFAARLSIAVVQFASFSVLILETVSAPRIQIARNFLICICIYFLFSIYVQMYVDTCIYIYIIFDLC